MSFETYTQNISAGKIFKFALLPDFKSRFQDLGNSLSWFVTFFASFFNISGLIENNHPCLRPENLGRYGFRDIIAIAYKNIQWRWSHFPQILMFFAVISSVIMSIAFIIAAVMYYFVEYAHAQGMFTLPGSHAPEDEYALQFLSRVFGDTGIGAFHTDVAAENAAAGAGDFSWLTLALQQMLKLYSQVMLFIGGFIVLYYLVAVVVESAQTGKPLGSRFSVWAPVRLAIAIMLLVPVPSSGGLSSGVPTGGYNGAQLIVFQTIAWGSNLATNVWIAALGAYADEDMVGRPYVDNNAQFVRGVFLIRTCMDAYNAAMDKAHVNNNRQRIQMRDDFDRQQNAMVYTFGVRANQDYCGSFRVPWPNTNVGSWDQGQVYTSPLGNISENGPANRIVEGYLNGYNYILTGSPYPITYMSDRITQIFMPGGNLNSESLDDQVLYDRHMILDWLSNFEAAVNAGVTAAVPEQNQLANVILREGATGGWANAGAFYMTLARLNGSLQSAISNSPEILKLPEIMASEDATPYGKEKRRRNRRAKRHLDDVHITIGKAKEWWNDYPLADNTANEVGSYGYAQVQSASPDDAASRSGSVDANQMFNFFSGPITSWLVINDELNPLGELMTLGGILVNVALGAVVMGGVLTNAFGVPGIGYAIMTMGLLFLSAGVALFVILPILPFFYFTFGVINWVIAVFEAIVGAPLWALSFLKIDGAGLPAGGMNGIYLIFLLFLHPTLMIFGLVGSILVFSAAVTFLNETFAVVTESIMSSRGTLGRGVSGVFYIIMYVIIVYMMGQSIFKMIDTIPKKISRFLGIGGPSTFSEMADPGELQNYTLVAAGAVMTMSGTAGGVADDTKAMKEKSQARRAKRQEKKNQNNQPGTKPEDDN